MNIYTEEEARSKVCPNTMSGEGTAYCEASECMAWQWSQEKETDAYLKDVKEYMINTPEKNFGKATAAVWADKKGSYAKTQGFCGLARK